jgi:hypothetical protein
MLVDPTGHMIAEDGKEVAVVTTRKVEEETTSGETTTNVIVIPISDTLPPPSTPSVTQSNIAPQTSTGTAASPPSNSYLTELAQEDAASLDSANSIQTAAYAPTTTATTQTSTPTTVTTTSSTSVSSTTSTSSAQTSISQVGISPAEFETGLAWGLVAGAAIGTLFFPPLILAVPPLIGGALAISDYSSIEGSQSTWGGGAAAWTEGAGRVLEAEDSILGDVFEMPLF